MLHLTPVLFNAQKKQVLSSFALVGKNRDLVNQRNGIREQNQVVVGRSLQTPVTYQAVLPYEDWMAEVSLDVQQIMAGCCDSYEMPVETLIEDRLLYYEVIPEFREKPYDYEFTELEQYTLENPFLHSMEDYENRYDILVKDRDKGSSVVIFTVGSHKLDMNFQGNKDVLNAIAKAFELIENDPNAILKHIVVAGYASPEGSLAFNTGLAQRRAETVKSFIQTLMSSPNEHLFELYNGREDWDGLREKVDLSMMAEKREILEIIDAYTMEQEIRKTRLKQLDGGVPYRYMLEHFYPPLRSAGYVQVYYEIDRTATVATAVTDEFGRTTWVDPDSPENINITRVNRATGYMMEGEFGKALEELLLTDGDPKSFNHIGVCYMMLKEYEKAEVWLRKAIDHGDGYAPANMEKLTKAKRVEIQ